MEAQSHVLWFCHNKFQQNWLFSLFYMEAVMKLVRFWISVSLNTQLLFFLSLSVIIWQMVLSNLHTNISLYPSVAMKSPRKRNNSFIRQPMRLFQLSPFTENTICYGGITFMTFTMNWNWHGWITCQLKQCFWISTSVPVLQCIFIDWIFHEIGTWV